MSIIDESIIQDFEEYSFWIKASLYRGSVVKTKI